MYALNNLVAPADYAAGATLICPGTVELNITVEDAPVLIQYAFRVNGYSDQAPQWTPENGVFLPPGFHTKGRNVEQIRVKSYTPGEPGTISIEAVS